MYAKRLQERLHVDIVTVIVVTCVQLTQAVCLQLTPRRLAYDGKGNAVVRSAAEIDAAVEALGG
jgi:phosphoribosylaminoimidazole carboxylase (NCAIR synthetase)